MASVLRVQEVTEALGTIGASRVQETDTLIVFTYGLPAASTTLTVVFALEHIECPLFGRHTKLRFECDFSFSCATWDDMDRKMLAHEWNRDHAGTFAFLLANDDGKFHIRSYYPLDIVSMPAAESIPKLVQYFNESVKGALGCVARASLEQESTTQEPSENDVASPSDVSSVRTQACRHFDSARPVDPASDAQIAQELWAQNVQHLIQKMTGVQDIEGHNGIADEVLTQDAVSVDMEDDEIYLLQHKRDPDEFHRALKEGLALLPIRKALLDANLAFKLNSGATMCIHPHQYEEAKKEALKHVGNRGLLGRHVVVAESLRHELESCLNEIGGRGAKGISVKKTSALTMTNDSSTIAQEEEEEAKNDDPLREDFAVTRTFLCRARSLRSADSVSHSTTDAHGGFNPRRVIMH